MNKKWVATIIGEDNSKIRIGVKGNKRNGYEVVCDNGEDPAIALQKTYDNALEAVGSSWGYNQNPWNFKWIAD